MTSPVQIDRQAFEVSAATPDQAIAMVLERARAIHPDARLDLVAMPEPDPDGMFTVIADYWLFPTEGA